MDLVKGGVIGILITKLDELANKEYGLQKGVKKKIQKQSRELRAVHAVLRKIGDVPPDQLDEQVKDWVCDIREASYDMEDIVDAFLVHVKSSPEPTDTNLLGRLLKKVSGFIEKFKDRRKISSLIDEINEKLEEVAERRGRYSVENIGVNPVASTAIDPRIMNLYKSATELVGIEGPRDELINMLSLGDDVDGSDMKLKIISVVGFGGLGKTTLAKAVYDHFKPQFKRRASVPVDRNPDMNKAADDQLKQHFECGVFVPVGRNPDMRKVFRDILIGLDEEKYPYKKLEGLDENQLMGKLNEFAKEKRCFIVIDDIWDKRPLELIKCAMQQSNYGSRLVITTREVATHAGDEAYKLQPLSRDNSEKLLFARIGDGEGNYFYSPSSEACEKILKKCGGVPLAIITLASLLAGKPGEDWSEVYNSIGFGHEANENIDNTRKILSFSYYDLPSHLKSCLLYLSVFPEDRIIEKNSLIWMWVAEGFISEEQAATAGVGSLFELGERFFNELINRSMIQPQERWHRGYVDACSVHDMVLDLIHQLSSEENFVTVVNGGERQKPQGRISRRLALHCVEVHNVGQLADIVVEKVRSIFASRCNFGALCPRLPFLRVVDLLECPVSQDCNKDMLDHLGSLLHLRYLRIESSSITELPRELKYLRFLQTLDLRQSSIEELPEEVGLLTQLVCLRLKDDGRPTSVPAGLIGKLTSLQELCIQCEGEYGTIMQFVKELGLLKELRVLRTRIFICSESVARSLLESLGHLHHIKELQIYCSGYQEVSNKVNRDVGWVSSRHLRFLHVERGLVCSRLSAWINSSLAPNLSYLKVPVVAVTDQDIETLAKLPELSCLVLYLRNDTESVVSIKIRTDEGVGNFRKLRRLSIHGRISIWFDQHSSECNSSRVPSSNTIMPSLEFLEFEVYVGSLKDKNLHLGFDKMLGFQNLGTSSLQRVEACVTREGADPREVEAAEAALKHAAAVHPKHPTLVCVRGLDIMSRYQEACMEMSRAPALVIKAWKLAGIVGSKDIQIMRMPETEASSSKVMRLLYTDNGVALLALSSNAIHKLWKWERSDKSSKSVPPVLWQPKKGILMANDATDGNVPEKATACTALSKNDQYLISASGGKVSLFNMNTFKVMTTFMAPPPASTFVAFYPLDNNIIAIGREDSSIHIYNVRTDYVQIVLTGHQKRITGLAFSESMGVLVSSGADAQLCVWSTDAWEKKKVKYIKHPSNGSSALVGDTMIQFHYDETRLLVVHETQLEIYDLQLECLCSWYPRDTLPAPITSAVYSLGCLLVYAGFRDGAIGIFNAESLTLQCRIAPSAYIPSSISSSGEPVYPTVVATHPWKPNQMAVGMSDGAVVVLEPLDTDNVQVGSDTSSEECPPSDVSNGGGHSQILDV